MTPDHFTTRQMKELHGIGHALQCHLRAARQLPYFKVGHRTVLYARADVEKFLARRRVAAVGDSNMGGQAHV